MASRILLLASSPDEYHILYLPYALLFLRSALENAGHEVTIVDFQLGAESYAHFKRELQRKPDILGVSLICGPGVALATKASQLCREISPNTCIVWGGILPTISTDLVLAENYVDYVIRYEAEKSFPIFVDAWENGEIKGKVPNLAYRDNGELVIPAAPTECNELTDFLPLDFSGADSSKYLLTEFHFGKRVCSIFTSRGCPYNCTFCYNLFVNRRSWRPFPIEWVLDTVDKLVKTFQIDGLLVLDDNFFVDRNRARKILEGVRAKGHRINWYAELRVDQLLEISVEELRELNRLGLVMLFLGAESGSNRILKLFNKGITSDHIREANLKLAQTDILPSYSFIIGAPTETAQETLETVDLSMELVAENRIASIYQYCQYAPSPGTPLYKLALKSGFEPYESLQDWDIRVIWRKKNMSSTSLGKSEMATLRYASLFQKSDLYISNYSLAFRLIYKMFRRVFRQRLRRHIFLPFFDTWIVWLIHQIFDTLERFRLTNIMKKLESRT